MLNATPHINTITAKINPLNIAESITNLTNDFPDQVTFSTSFSWEDQAIAHLIFSNQLPVDVFTLDTGRMFAETYSTWSRTVDMYEQKITAYYPNANALQTVVIKP